MSGANTTDPDPSFKPFTKAERIQQLNDIDKSITQLLHSAGLALKTLTDAQSPNSSRKADFQSASENFFKTLQKTDIGMKRQIWGLEEADIIPAKKEEGDAGMGKLDIGLLNSRSGRVGRDMEAELWEKASDFWEKNAEKKQNREDVEMEG